MFLLNLNSLVKLNSQIDHDECLSDYNYFYSPLFQMAEIDGRDAVEIICNTESVEKDELLLSLCKAFLKQQLHNGDMYYIW